MERPSAGRPADAAAALTAAAGAGPPGGAAEAPAPEGDDSTHSLYVDFGGEGDLESPPVVLVHGVLDSSRSFTRLRRLMSNGTRVVSYDRRGYQRSRAAWRRAAGVEVHVEDLLNIIEGLDAHERALGLVVLGHSYGGVVALAAAQRRPDLVAAVLAFEPPISWQPPPRGLDVAPREWTVPHLDEDAARFGDRFARMMLGSPRYDRLGADIRAGLADDAVQATFELAELTSLPAFDPTAITVPVIVARGELATHRHVACTDWLAGALPAGRLVVIEGASHAAHISHPKKLATLLDELASVAVAGSRTAVRLDEHEGGTT